MALRVNPEGVKDLDDTVWARFPPCQQQMLSAASPQTHSTRRPQVQAQLTRVLAALLAAQLRLCLCSWLT
jgi:hypothetical protein